MDQAKNEQKPQRKRKRSLVIDPLKEAYKNMTFIPRPSSGRPGSPHRFFKSSYTVTHQTTEGNEKEGPTSIVGNEQSDATSSTTTMYREPIQQVVHQHANGLCIITVGDSVNPKDMISGVDVCAKVAPEMSAAERRKCQSKMLHRQGFIEDAGPGIATPRGVLARLDVDGEQRPVYGCVWGHILETNANLTPKLLQNDPLLDGYIAIVLPTGPFPPPQDESTDGKVNSRVLSSSGTA